MVNKEFDQSRYQAGRLEAKTRNAFLGKKRQYDLKAQFLSNPSAPVETFNPLDQKFITKLAGENPQQQERLVSFVNNFQTFKSSFGPDLELQNAPLVWQAVDRIEALKSQPIREKILNQIKAKKEQAQQVTVSEPVLQPENALKNTISTIWQLQSEKFRAGLKSILDLPFFIINNLPDRVYRVLPITTILALVLSACASVAVVPQPEITNQNDPVPGETTGLPDSATGEAPIITNTVEPSPTATVEPSPTATERVMTLEERVDAFATGRIEFPTNLSPEEYSAFIDEMNNHVGRQAIWVESLRNSDGSPVVLYFDIEQSKMVMLPGSYEENREIIDRNQLEMFVKISEEAGTGNLQYTNSNGELITSPDSADVNWNLRVDASNYEDGLIDLPEVSGSVENYWYETFEGMIADDKKVLIPGILIDDTVSMLISRQGGWNKYPCLNMLFIVTDKQGKPLYGIRTFVGGGPILFLANEGGTLDVGSSKIQLLNSNETKKFEAGAVYYTSFSTQQKAWDEYNRANIDELQGVDSVTNSFDNAFNQNVPDDGNIILAGTHFIKKK